MTFRVNIRFGHLDRMPRCEHGRVEGFCSPCDALAAGSFAQDRKAGLGPKGARAAREAGNAQPLPPSKDSNNED